jgi:hypothetical protein
MRNLSNYHLHHLESLKFRAKKGKSKEKPSFLLSLAALVRGVLLFHMTRTKKTNKNALTNHRNAKK